MNTLKKPLKNSYQFYTFPYSIVKILKIGDKIKENDFWVSFVGEDFVKVDKNQIGEKITRNHMPFFRPIK